MNNADRVERVRPLFESYWNVDRDEYQTALVDLVTDLGHLADTFGIDFDRVLETVRLHLSEELAGTP